MQTRATAEATQAGSGEPRPHFRPSSSEVKGMRLAIHSIMWGEDIPLARILQEVQQAGYAGLELFHHPANLGPAERIHEQIRALGLHLVGSSGGSFEERVRFVRDYARAMGRAVSDPEVPYVYLDDQVDARVTDALEEGFRIGLHPHMYKPVQTLSEAAEVLARYPKLRFLPDTAHLTIAGDEPMKAIEQFATRIDAVHMKDWLENVGRSYHFYARGFCQLGMGDIDLEAVLNTLVKRAYNTWLVVEQDWSTQPLADAKRSFDWLTANLPGRPSVQTRGR